MTFSAPLLSSPSPGAQPREHPVPGATFGQAIRRYYERYATVSGRASRSEFWWVTLYHSLVVGGLWWLADATGAWGDPETGAEPSSLGTVLAVLVILFVVVSVVPAVSLHARRLHDADLSGWWLLLGLLPTLGGLVLTIFALLPSSRAGARFDA